MASIYLIRDPKDAAFRAPMFKSTKGGFEETVAEFGADPLADLSSRHRWFAGATNPRRATAEAARFSQRGLLRSGPARIPR